MAGYPVFVKERYGADGHANKNSQSVRPQIRMLEVNLFDFFIPQSKAEAVTDAIAVGSVSSPFWLHTTSEIAQVLLPIVGLVWLVVQITIKVHTTYWKRK